MNEYAIVVAVTAATVQLIIMSLSVFCIGFFIGFKREDKKIVQKNLEKDKIDDEQEARAKKEWKRFLSYDGSNTDKNSF